MLHSGAADLVSKGTQTRVLQVRWRCAPDATISPTRAAPQRTRLYIVHLASVTDRIHGALAT